MYEFIYTSTSGNEWTEQIRADSYEQAETWFRESHPDACIVRVVGPWAITS